jgi:hypothetical protein
LPLFNKNIKTLKIMTVAKIVFLSLMAIQLGIGITKDGEPRSPVSGAGTVINYILTMLLLWWCDFFN